MSAEEPPHERRRPIAMIQNVGSLVVAAVLLVVGFWGGHFLAPGHPSIDDLDTPSELETVTPTEVTLSPAKVASAGLSVREVACGTVQRTKTVTGMIDYDANRHLTIKAPVQGVVKQLLVKSGQRVAAGEPIALLSGAEIALARTEVQKSAADVRIAQMNFDWCQETQKNLRELLATLKERPSVDTVESQFEGKRLGEHRDHLLTTYTKYVLATRDADRSKPLGDRGIIAGRTAEARSSERDVAASTFQSVCEQSEFEGRQDLAKAQAELELAQQNQAVARDRLRLLLGPFADDATSEAPGSFEVRAPFSGRIEAIHVAPASRLAQGDVVLTLADTTKLWVSALIHQHDWEALQIQEGTTLLVQVPALPQEQFEAQVRFIGPGVSASTRAVSIVAELDNGDGRFRPGMFAWVKMPMEPARQSLVVPPAAIQRHESEAFVFVAEGEHRFRRVGVTTGIETEEQVEITQGLTAGQAVVDRGAFFLKSELLLEQEE